MEQTKFYLCRNLKDGFKPLPFSILEDCDGCGSKIWVSRSTIQMRDRDNSFTVCQKCFGKMPAQEFDTAPLTREQIAEIKQGMRYGTKKEFS